jgi:hypothetical protein
MIFGMVNWSVNWYRPEGPKTADELADDFADILLGGLRAGRPLNGERTDESQSSSEKHQFGKRRQQAPSNRQRVS